MSSVNIVYILFANDGYDPLIVGIYDSEEVANEALSYCEEINSFPKHISFYIERHTVHNEAFCGTGNTKIFRGNTDFL